MPKKQSLLEQTIEKLLEDLKPQDAKARPSDEGEPLLRLVNYKTGWNKFLKTVGRSTFASEFSEFHAGFWNWYWKITNLRYHNKSLSDEVLTYLAMWGRGNAKSSSVEWASIVEGAVGLKGYVLYVSATQVSANAHIESIRKRLEGADIGLYFPHLSEPLIGTHGNQYGWRQEFLITKGGWAIRPVGLDVGIRGAKSEDLRPTMIIFDDIDSHKDTLATVQSKIETISREIIPAGTPNTIYLLANNLVHENSITNQIHTGKTDILANHIPSFVPTFSELDIETEINETTGKTRHIIKHATPTWAHFDITEAQRFLDNSGLFSFYAEYQHDFKLDSTDKVLPEYLDYPTHVISWSQFEERYKTRNTVPVHWQKGVGLDLGYTDAHISAWTWLAVGAQDSGLPNAHFCYRGMTFVGTSIDEQAEQVLNRLKIKQGIGLGIVNEFKQGYSLQKMSHEKLGERYQLNRKYNFSFSAFKKGKEEGIPEWRELLRVDKRKPHPFHNDPLLIGEDGTPTGEYTIGRPNFFYVVEDSQVITASDDFGLAIHRSQAFNWKRRKVKLTVTGLSDDKPMKIEDDTLDSLRGILAERLLDSTPKTMHQRVEDALPEFYSPENMEAMRGMEDFGGILLARQMQAQEIIRAEEQRVKNVIDMLTRSLAPDPRGSGRGKQTRPKSLWRS